jgi:hypothetical protein
MDVSINSGTNPRKLSIDSESSGTSNDTSKPRKQKLIIKKKLLKQKQPPFMILSPGAENPLAMNNL